MPEESRNRRAYMRNYQREWMRRRRDAWIAEHGPCAHCGSAEQLEVDHVDPSAKLYEPREIWSRRAEVREAELAKCQVLCHDCHLAKTVSAYPVPLHGTRTRYVKHRCRCQPCRGASATYERERRSRKSCA